MVALAFLAMGLLFGLALALVLGGFLVLLQTEENRALLRAGRLPILHLLGLRHAPPPARRPDLEPRLRALQEELRVTQRLVDQARAEREARQAEQRQRDEELAALRAQLAERTARCAELTATFGTEQDRARSLEDQLSSRSDELSRANTTLRDLRTELDVVQSGDTVTLAQLERVRNERDSLAALVVKLRRALAAARAAAPGTSRA